MKKFKVGIVFFVLGLIGVLSLLSMPFPMEILPKEAQEIILKDFTLMQLRWLNLTNPTMLLFSSAILGAFLHQKVGFKSIIVYYFFDKKEIFTSVNNSLKTGLIGGGVLGIILFFIWLFTKNLEFVHILENKITSPSWYSRILYGGITEEIIVRWGWMSLVVYILQFLIKSNYKLVVTIAILFSSFLFGLAHLPLVVVGIGIENLTLTISSYVIGTNMLVGIVLGIVYYKSSIEAAMLSHILAHVFLILVELVIILS
jgi:hypothetical protein